MAGPWEKYAAQPQSAGGLYSIPDKADPDKALRHQLLALDLQKKMKDATKEQVGDTQVHALAKLYATNKLIPPTRPNEVAQKAIAEAMTIDPNYDPELSTNRLQAIKDFTGAGKASSAIGAVNRLAENLQELKAISDKMGGPNLHVKPLNHLVAGVEQMGEPDLVARYDALLPEIANQFDLIMKSNKGAPTVSGTQEVTQGLARARSQAERDAAFQEVAKAVHGAITPLKDQWNSAYGGTKAPPMWVSKSAGDFFSSIDPKHADDYGGNDWRGLPGLKGDGTQPTPMGGNPPPGGPPGSPPPGSPGLAPAGGPTKTDYVQTDVDKKVAAMLAGGAPASQIKKFAADNGGGYPHLDSVLAWRALHPAYKGGYDVSTQHIVPTTEVNRFAASPTGTFLTQAGDAMTAGFGDEIVGGVKALQTGNPVGQEIASTDFAKQLQASANPTSALLGNMAGGATAMIGGGLGLKALLAGGAKGGVGRNILAWSARNPLKAAALGDGAYGAAYGAGENNDNRALGAGIGALTGAVASPVGSAVTSGAGKVLQGVVNPAVRRLTDAGIPLTVGEVIGGGAKKAQDALTSVFGPGNMVARRYADGRRAMNLAAFNEAGAPIGANIADMGQAGVNALDAAKSNAYSRALDPVSLNLNDPSFLGPMQGIMAGAQQIPAGELPEGYAANAIKHFIGNNMDQGGGMTGPGFQNAYRGMAKVANKASSKVEGHDVGQALGQAKDVLASALEAQQPGAYDGFLRANAANRNLNVIARAVDAAKNQVADGGEIHFTPAQLGQAASQNANTYSGKIASAGGTRPFNQLALDAQQVMSSKLPDSGTAMRIATMAGLTAAGGGTGYGVDGGEGALEGAALPMGVLTALGTRRGQQLMTAALMKRTIQDQIAGRALTNNPTVGGGLLASLGIPLLDTPSR